jgi:FecR protein
MKPRFPLLLLVLLLACSWTTALWAADPLPIGELVVQQGLLKVRRNEQELVFRASQRKIPMFVGDEVQSAKETRATLSFRKNDEVIVLYASSYFRVEDVQPVRSVFALSVGKAIFAVARRLSQQIFEVRTPTATIGVKGTEFVVGTDGIHKTFLLTLTGAVSMSSNDFPDIEVLVRKDQASFTTKGKLPTPPSPVTPEMRESIRSDEGLKSMISAEALAPPPPEPPGADKDGQNSGGSSSNGGPPVTTLPLDTLQDAQQTISTSTETTTSSAAAQLQLLLDRSGTPPPPDTNPPPVGITITR